MLKWTRIASTTERVAIGHSKFMKNRGKEGKTATFWCWHIMKRHVSKGLFTLIKERETARNRGWKRLVFGCLPAGSANHLQKINIYVGQRLLLSSFRVFFFFFEAFEQVLMASQNWSTGRKRPADLTLWEQRRTTNRSWQKSPGWLRSNWVE